MKATKKFAEAKVICVKCGARQRVKALEGSLKFKCINCSYIGGYVNCWYYCRDGDLHPRCSKTYDSALAVCPICGCAH